MIEELKRYIGPLPSMSFVKFKSGDNVGEILFYPHINDTPAISVIIPTRDAWGKGCFPALLERLRWQSHWDQIEIIVVKGDTRQGRAINTGVALAKGKYLITLDDDVKLKNNFVFEKLVNALENDSSIGMAGGINVIPDDATDFVRRTMKELPRRSTPLINKIVDSDMAEHPLLIMRKGDFLNIGGENELIPRGLDPYLREEYRRAGFRVVIVPGAYYSHLTPSTFSKLIKQFFKNGKQAAFCNIFYPQWVIETPDYHGEFVPRKSFLNRILRYLKELLKAILGGKWILLSSKVAYASGFIMEAMFSQRFKIKQSL